MRRYNIIFTTAIPRSFWNERAAGERSALSAASYGRVQCAEARVWIEGLNKAPSMSHLARSLFAIVKCNKLHKSKFVVRFECVAEFTEHHAATIPHGVFLGMPTFLGQLLFCSTSLLIQPNKLLLQFCPISPPL